MTHRGLLHHVIITVSNLERSMPFYRAVLGNLGYECNGANFGEGHRYEDWKRWDSDTPHEIGIGEGSPEHAGVKCVRGAVGHHHHMAFCALDRADVDRFHADVLVPLAKAGHCAIEDAPCDCPEYGEGYYATFFHDPDGLKYEFVFNPNHLRKKAGRS
jgi:catechol 2,3-dioxygenase-like lactoylglutathione lyase family enzyme